jgi:glycerol-3-phosphate acyltransferase PlsY
LPAGAVMTMVGLAAGSLMFSHWLVRLRGADVRRVGDGNPGPANAFKAGGVGVGIAALWLDFLKGAVPVAVARWGLHIDGWWLVPVIVAPVIGHAFSPFLGFKGGKAVDVTVGVWCGITLWEAPCLLGAVLLLGKYVFRAKNDAWIVMAGLAALLVCIVLRWHSPVLVVAAAGNAAVVAFKHRRLLLGT